jgi:hypothetical protein
VQAKLCSPLPHVLIEPSTGHDTEIEASKAKYERTMAARERKQEAADKYESSCGLRRQSTHRNKSTTETPRIYLGVFITGGKFL